MRTRIAPTPSGYLHLGNAVNARLVDWLARGLGGTVALRIDDVDAARARTEYVDDVFSVLDWLAIGWQVGPRDATDFAAGWSQRDRTERYRAELDAARVRGLEVYACSCTRRMLVGVPTGGCPGRCRAAAVAYVPGVHALRVHVPVGTRVDAGGEPVALDERMGDFVIWRRDDLPAYQLVSVVEDRDGGVTHVVRGMDLVESTAAQLFLSRYLGAGSLSSATFLHHALLTDHAGHKLSKSQLRSGRPLARTDEARRAVDEHALRIGAPLGIEPPD